MLKNFIFIRKSKNFEEKFKENIIMNLKKKVEKVKVKNYPLMLCISFSEILSIRDFSFIVNLLGNNYIPDAEVNIKGEFIVLKSYKRVRNFILNFLKDLNKIKETPNSLLLSSSSKYDDVEEEGLIVIAKKWDRSKTLISLKIITPYLSIVPKEVLKDFNIE